MIKLILPTDSALYHALEHLIGSQQIVFLVGLPGVGKSMISQQLALMAHQVGRNVHLLQWDVARQPFVTDAYALKNYPEVDGITHSAVRKAVGLWARAAIGQWYHQHPDETDLLIGEAPLVGNRMIELLQRDDDDVEPILSSSTTTFVFPVPSREVRRIIEGKREASSANPQHERDRSDAIPQVLRGAWAELYRAAYELRIISNAVGDHVDYDPDVYKGVFSSLLKHRQSQGVPLTIQLPTEHLSAHSFPFPHDELAPKTDEVQRYLTQVEQLYPEMESLEREMNQWYIV